MNEISRRRLAGFLLLALAMVVGTLTFAFFTSPSAPTDDATAPPSAPAIVASAPPSALPTAPAVASPLASAPLDVGASQAPGRSIAPVPTVGPPQHSETPLEPGTTFEIPPPIR